MLIRYATAHDIPAIEAIARQHPAELAFVRRVALQRGVDQRELFVAEVGGQVVGFVSWHARRDGWSTIYDLATHRDYQRQGVGRALLYAVPCPVRLKCTVDNPANEFYRRAGMQQVGTESGVWRALNVWEMRVLSVIVRGDNATVPGIARAAGNAYGIHHAAKAHAWPWMVDSDPEHCDWSALLAVVHEQHPIQVLTADYFPGQREMMLSQVADLRAAEVLRIAVCPKFHDAVADIPADCVVAVSLRTNGKMTRGANKYAGFMPDFAELRGRRVHLLGGSPALQKRTLVQLQGAGARVMSVDGSAHLGAAGKGSAFIDGSWRRKAGERADLQATALLSSANIQRELNAAAGWQQLSLF